MPISADLVASISHDDHEYGFIDLARAAARHGQQDGIAALPVCLRILLENQLRHAHRLDREPEEILREFAEWPLRAKTGAVPFFPERILMQDNTALPVFVDLLRVTRSVTAGTEAQHGLRPAVHVDLVIDHSISVDMAGCREAADHNLQIEFERHRERYSFFRSCERAFAGLRIVPPGNGICHQVNLESLACVIRSTKHGSGTLLAPDTVIGTDSHTPMINGLGVLGWGVGGLEAEALILGEPSWIPPTEVVGVKLTGRQPPGVLPADLALALAQALRERNVSGKLVEFYGPALEFLGVEDRATISNMAPEYGATCAFFPIDEKTVRFLALTRGDKRHAALVESYARRQGLWWEPGVSEPVYSECIEIDFDRIRPSLAGPNRPDRPLPLDQVRTGFSQFLAERGQSARTREVPVPGTGYTVRDGAVIIAAITSCTNTSNPASMIGAGLLARNARRRGLRPKPWVKTSLAPGSKAVMHYLRAAGLDDDLSALGFDLVGYGCTTCIGNSGPIAPGLRQVLDEHELRLCSVSSGNRNFAGRISPYTEANFLASPPLVLAYALAGRIDVDLTTEPIGYDDEGTPVSFADLWPDAGEIDHVLRESVSPSCFRESYDGLFDGPPAWNGIDPEPLAYWESGRSSYVQVMPVERKPETGRQAIRSARPIAILGDRVTTDDLSPAGPIPHDSLAARYLAESGVAAADYNSYGARRGNAEVMLRGLLSNPALRNRMAPSTRGPYTRYHPGGEVLEIYEAARRYREANVPLILIAGHEYGSGSSRDWAAKGLAMLGVAAVMARSFERIHRVNLVLSGVLPLQFRAGEGADELQLTGDETFELDLDRVPLGPGSSVDCRVSRSGGAEVRFELACRLDHDSELSYFRAGGLLPLAVERLSSRA